MRPPRRPCCLACTGWDVTNVQCGNSGTEMPFASSGDSEYETSIRPVPSVLHFAVAPPTCGRQKAQTGNLQLSLNATGFPTSALCACIKLSILYPPHSNRHESRSLRYDRSSKPFDPTAPNRSTKGGCWVSRCQECLPLPGCSIRR